MRPTPILPFRRPDIRPFALAPAMLAAAIIAVLALLAASSCRAGDTVGFREITVPDAAGSRPLHVVIWYPGDDPRPRTIVDENGAFPGFSVTRDAVAAAGSHPLVVLSHGFGGNWRNLGWLAGILVGQGYVVAAPDHPGTTYSDRRTSEAMRLWERPHDVSRTIDAVLADPALAGGIAPDRIAAIGHSLGGWTVAELAGGRFDTDRLAKDCVASSDTELCKTYRVLGIGSGEAARASLGNDLADRRVRAVITLDMGPARGFTRESLAAIDIPMLVIAAGSDLPGMAATNRDSAFLAAGLPAATVTRVVIPDALHFSFMQICKPGAAALIEAKTPGDGVVCSDGGTRGRQAIHDEVSAMIVSFLARALPPR